MKTLKRVIGKSKNRRIGIFIFEDEGEKMIFIETKRLASLKNRDVVKSATTFSIETFIRLSSIMHEIYCSEYFQDEFKDIISEIMQKRFMQ